MPAVQFWGLPKSSISRNRPASAKISCVVSKLLAEGDNKQEMITWSEKKDLKLGDEITIRFIEIEKPSKPPEVRKIEPDENE